MVGGVAPTFSSEFCGGGSRLHPERRRGPARKIYCVTFDDEGEAEHTSGSQQHIEKLQCLLWAAAAHSTTGAMPRGAPEKIEPLFWVKRCDHTWVFNTWFLAGRNSSVSRVWAGPADPKTIPKGEGLRPPPHRLELILGPPRSTISGRPKNHVFKTQVWYVPGGQHDSTRYDGRARAQ